MLIIKLNQAGRLFRRVVHGVILCAIGLSMLLTPFGLASAADGDPVNTFGTDGQVIFNPSAYDDSGYVVLALANGKSLVGIHNPYEADAAGEFTIARFNSDGSLDDTFGANGYAKTNFGSGWSALGDIAVLSDGRIVAVGTYQPAGQLYRLFALARFCPDGTLDTNTNCPSLTPKFGTGGKVTTQIHTGGSNQSIALAVALQADGKIVAGGLATSPTIPFLFAVARYNTDGSLDTSFDTDGIVLTQIANYWNIINDILIDTNGKIVAVGFANPASDYPRFTVARYNANGALDTTFSADGHTTTRVGDHSIAYAVRLQPDGKLVVAGKAYSSYSNNQMGFAVARYNTIGGLDYNFSTNGWLIDYYDPAVQFDTANAVLLDQTGRIVVAGNTYTDATHTSQVTASARLCSDGSLDNGTVCSSTGYGGDGRAVGDFTGASATIRSLALNSQDQSIFASGEVNTGAQLEAFLMLVEGNGDESFTISGNTEVGGVTLSYTDGTAKTATSAGNGDYSFEVSYNWSGTVTPSLPGYSFDPSVKTYQNVVADHTGQNFDAIPTTTYTISGNTGVGDVTLSYSAGTASSDTNGNYAITVPAGWSGSITPSRAGFTFTPVNLPYSNVLSDQPDQDYTAVYQAPQLQGATEIAYNTFTVNWTGSPGATGYRLDVATDSGFTQFVSGYQDLEISGGSVTSYLVVGLQPNTLHYYRLRAVTTGATSPNSGTGQVFTHQATFLPIILSTLAQ